MKKSILNGVLGLAMTAVWAGNVSAADPIRVGVPVVFSGPGAFVGTAEKNTLEMMAQDLNAKGGINGRPIKFIYYDTEAKPDVAVRMVTRLIKKDQVDAILGPTASWTGLPAKPIVEKFKMPTIMLASGSALVVPVAKWVFKVPPDDRIVVNRLLTHFKAKNITRVALTSSQDGFGNGGRKAFLANAVKFGVKVVFDERYTMEDTDLSPMLNKIKKTDAQVVLNWSSGKAPIVFAMNYKQVGIKLPHYESHGPLSAQFLKAVGDNAKGIMLAGPKIEGYKNLADSDPQKKVITAFKNAYRANYKAEGNLFGSGAYDAFNILVAALKKAGTDKAKLRDAIEQTTGYVGVGGIYNFSATDHGGLSGKSLVMYQATVKSMY